MKRSLDGIRRTFNGQPSRRKASVIMQPSDIEKEVVMAAM